MPRKNANDGATPERLKNLKMDTGTIPETEFIPLLDSFGVHVPEEIDLPFSYKLNDKHTLVVERRSGQLVTEDGLVSQLNWRVHENMVNRVSRD